MKKIKKIHNTTTPGIQSANLGAKILPDLGMYFIKMGMEKSTIVIPSAPFVKFYELPDDTGTLSSSVASGIPPNARLATFDFKGTAREELFALLRQEFPNCIEDASKGNKPIQIGLPSPIILALKAVVGDVHTDEDNRQFAPLIVVDIQKYLGPV